MVSKLGETESESIEHAAEPAEHEEPTSDTTDIGSDDGLPDYDPGELSSRRHFLTEVDLQPDEFFTRLVGDEGGTLPQKEFTEFTDLSSSTVSRILQEMEDDGQVVRVQVGRENIVCLPQHVPWDDVTTTGDPDDTDDTDDRLRV